MKKAKNKLVPEFGAIAILDALGAKNYSEDDINQFLLSRERVLQDLNAWVGEQHGSVNLRGSDLVTFTFNDTIIIVLRGGAKPLPFAQVTSFAAVLRKFIADSMQVGLLFRGAAALGSFRVDEETNTVLGDAVTDAAQWYEATDWVGLHFTPRSCLELSAMFEESQSKQRWAMFSYPVPLKGGSTLNAYAINWPKILMVPSLSPWKDQRPPRVQLLKSLSNHRIPKDTQSKYANTVAFFDHSFKVESEANAERLKRKTKRVAKKAKSK